MRLYKNFFVALTVVTVGCTADGIYEYDADMPVWRLPDDAVEIGINTYFIGVEYDDLGREIEGRAFVHGVDEGRDLALRRPPGGSCYSVLGRGARWKGTPEPWSVDNSNSPVGVVTDELETDVGTWETAAAADVLGGGSSDNGYDAVLSETDDVNGAEWGVITDPGVIAVTYVWGIFGGPPDTRELVEWDQIYDTDWAWSLDGSPDTFDFENIATHELGHAFGLGHPSNVCTEETMYAYADFGETKKRDLNAGDIAGINSLY